MSNAIRLKDIKAVEALLAKGARIDTLDSSGTTAMAYAESLGDVAVIELLRAHIGNALPA